MAAPDSVIPLWPDDSPHNPKQKEHRPRLELYQPKQKAAGPVPAVIVCPGGGYGGRAAHEGAPFAELFAAHGFVAFVCHYRVSPHRHPAPMTDACRAVRMVRHLATDFAVDPKRIALMGFSAGGHLASTVATQPTLHVDELDDLAEHHDARPDRAILGYPVISMVEHYHQGSAANLLGQNPSLAARHQMSNELHVTAKNPPAFIFHTFDDKAVPVQNALMFTSACAKAGVPVEMHVYQSGPHGVGIAADRPTLKSWTGLLIDWLKAWK